MALDERFILVENLQDLYRDKDTGLPLRNGRIDFYEDKSRNTPKQVYTISGSPPNYTYVSLGTTIDLNSAGYVGDPSINQYYYFPFDADPDTSLGTVDLYYIEIYSSDNVLQGTREAWPNIISEGGGTSDPITLNYVANGQLKLHTELPASGDFVEGEVRDEQTDFAYGGFQYNGSSSPTGEILIDFERLISFGTNPEKNPRYAVQIRKTGSSAESSAEIRIIFGDVNKFSSTTSDEFTFAFTAKSPISTGITSIDIIKNFGTGGSPTPEQRTTIATGIPLIASYTKKVFNFDFGDNSGDIIGLNDDDFVAIAIVLPSSLLFNVFFTDFILAEGTFDDPAYPYETDRKFITDSLGGGFPIPAHDGSDLFLPPLLTKDGWIYDHSQIGKIYSAVYETPDFGELLCDGAKYDPSEYSTDGIPYSRLFNTIGITFGNGTDYSFCFNYETPSSSLIFSNNDFGAVTTPTNGTASPGFTFSSIHTGISSGYFVDTHLIASNEIVVKNLQSSNESMKTSLAPATPSAGTSGFTLSVPIEYDAYEQNILASSSNVFNSQRGLFIISGLPATATALAGLYFEFDSVSSNVKQEYYVWFTVDAVGVDPAPAGRMAVKIDLLSTDTDDDIATKIMRSLRGSETVNITTVIGSSITSGDNWLFNSTVDNYYVYYEVDGTTGNDPDVSGRIGIKVDILSTDTDQEVSQKTIDSVNERYFSVPPFNEGYFLRGWDINGVNDIDNLSRFNPFTNEVGANLGSFQLYQVQSHNHDMGKGIKLATNPDGGESIDSDPSANKRTTFSGGSETRPINAYVNYIIKY